MPQSNIDKDGRLHLAIIENHLIELYYSAAQSERSKLLSEIRMMIQEKDSQNDIVAVGVLQWALDRLHKA
jgi:hypothetical protein